MAGKGLDWRVRTEYYFSSPSCSHLLRQALYLKQKLPREGEAWGVSTIYGVPLRPALYDMCDDKRVPFVDALN